MWWDYGYNVTTGSEVDEAWSVSSQYLFGDVLVNPVTDWVDPQSSTMNTTALTAENKTTWLPAVRAKNQYHSCLVWRQVSGCLDSRSIPVPALERPQLSTCSLENPTHTVTEGWTLS